jgi:antirestriction protein ArdC
MSEEQAPRKFYINKFLSDRFVERIKGGLVPWRRPWIGKAPLQNGVSGHQYQGLNTFQLTLASIENDFRQPYWLTWNQIHKFAGDILPEHKRNGTMFVFYKDFPIKETVQVEDPETGELVDQEVEKRIPLIRYGTLYNVAQCKNLKVSALPAYKATERLGEGENRVVSQTVLDLLKQASQLPRISISNDATEAFYDRRSNVVVTPPQSRCESDEMFSFGLFKAAVSATGCPDLLDRPTFGDSFNADREELITELGAGLLCGKLGIRPPQKVDENTIDGWVKALNSDPRLLVRAGIQAQKAVALIVGNPQAFVQRQSRPEARSGANVFREEPPPLQDQSQTASEEKQYTAVDVLYRDSGNYKQFETYIVEGNLSYDDLKPHLSQGTYFVGKDVQMEDLVFRFVERDGMDLNEEDNPWQELHAVAPTTAAEAHKSQQEDRFLGSAAEIVQRFKKASEANWPSHPEVAATILKYAGLDPQQIQNEADRQNRSIGY